MALTEFRGDTWIARRAFADLRESLGFETTIVVAMRQEGPRILDRLLREPGGGGGT
jgi:hypothetical protein